MNNRCLNSVVVSKVAKKFIFHNMPMDSTIKQT